MKKRGFAFVFAIILLISVLPSFSSALGISPAVVEINYEPYAQHSVTLKIYEKDPNRKVTMSAEGELAPFVRFDKSEFRGSDTVVATIMLPGEMKTPGKNIFYLVAAEEPPESVFIGTAIRVRATVKVYVPYPGKYIEPSLATSSANVGEQIPVELAVINRGTDSLTIMPVINFYDSSGTAVSKMEFEPVRADSGETTYFRKYLDTSNLQPDDYLAVAEIDFGGEKQYINSSFRVGDLSLSITDFTKNITLNENKINKFSIKIKSNWNGNIEGAYADVSVYRDAFTKKFVTPQMEMTPWEEKWLDGYFDSSDVSPGKYNVDILLHYSGETSSASGELIVYKTPLSMTLKILLAIAGLVLVSGLVYSGVRFSKHSRPVSRR